MTRTARPNVFMYSGQGSQYYQMTRQLYAEHPRYRLWMDYCEDVASPVLGASVLDTVFDPAKARGDAFDSLSASSAALICVEYSLTRVVQELGHQPDLLLGYSLGEITAAVVGEVLSLEAGITAAVEVARLIETRTAPGGMLAVMADDATVGRYGGLMARCTVTAHNFAGHLVISGPEPAVDALQHALEQDLVLCQRLPVRHGVHTDLIDPVEDEALRVLGTFDYAPSRVPLVSPVSLGRVARVDAAGIWTVLRRPVGFAATVRRLCAERDWTFLDLGPSATLATFVKHLLPPDAGSIQVGTVDRFGNDSKAIERFQDRMIRRGAMTGATA